MAENINSYYSDYYYEIRILDLMGESTWTILDFRKKLLEDGINCFNSSTVGLNSKEEFHVRSFLKKRPKLFGMTKTHVWCIFNFEPFELQILNSMGEKLWKIADLLILLQDNKIGTFKTESSLHNFLKKRPKLFSMTQTHVWNAKKMFKEDYNENMEIEQIQQKKEYLPSVKNLDPLEIQILTLMDVSPWRISDLRTKLLENGLNTFKPEKQLHNFLKKRPNLFGLTETHVWSLVDHIHTLKKVKMPPNKETTSKKKKRSQER